jgi:A/G-specific adenine glycosylase
VSNDEESLFLETLWGYYDRHGRHDLPWRQTELNGQIGPYKIMVSELMLQQTQVGRVIPKYDQFLQAFPTISDLAAAEVGDVLRAWQGLGYNRRAKFLWQAARVVAALPNFPTEQTELIKLPGIGVNTAGAIRAYAFNQPVAFVETNIRTVYIYHFFEGEIEISDKMILATLERTLDVERPREFYWALMDYGTHLKATVGNLSTLSKHYVKQSTFMGSKRQVRGQVIRLLGSGPQLLAELEREVTDERLEVVLAELVNEGLIRVEHSVYAL